MLIRNQNHLIETASAKTGSLIIWDTGEYEILPYEETQSLPETDDSRSIDSDGPELPAEAISHSQRLKEAFKNVSFVQPVASTGLNEN